MNRDVQLLHGELVTPVEEFLLNTKSELLILSPWMTLGAAYLIAKSLSNNRREIKVKIISRLDEEDFYSGASHLNAFRKQTYPSNINLEIKCLKYLHAKMLISDGINTIIGSANLTDGGLYRNHEAMVRLHSKDFTSKCTEFFFELWDKSTLVDEKFFITMENNIKNRVHAVEDDGAIDENRYGIFSGIKKTAGRLIRYFRPKGAQKAQKKIQDIQQQIFSPIIIHNEETVDEAMKWLNEISRMSSKEKTKLDTRIRIERLFYHHDLGVRATAIDHAGRLGDHYYAPRLQAILQSIDEKAEVRSASAFALALLSAPEVFGILRSVSRETTDAGRWAKRGCFLLLSIVEEDESKLFLDDLGVKEPSVALELAKTMASAKGSVSERLTKALIIEKTSTGEWSESTMDILCYLMFQLSRKVRKGKRYDDYDKFLRLSAQLLNVSAGDLRHGPLSVKLLHRVSDKGWEDYGLMICLGTIWNNIQETSTEIEKKIKKMHNIRPLLDLMEK